MSIYCKILLVTNCTILRVTYSSILSVTYCPILHVIYCTVLRVTYWTILHVIYCTILNVIHFCATPSNLVIIHYTDSLDINVSQETLGLLNQSNNKASHYNDIILSLFLVHTLYKWNFLAETQNTIQYNTNIFILCEQFIHEIHF